MSASDDSILDSNTMVPTLDRQKAYSIAQLQQFYVCSVDPIETFAETYGVSPALVQRCVREGRWDELRVSRAKQAQQILKKIDLIEAIDLLSLQLKIQILSKTQISQDLKEVEAHYLKYGHLFVVDAKGHIVKGSQNLPMKLSLPTLNRASQEMIAALQERISILQKQVAEAEEATEQERLAGATDVSSYQHLFESRDE